MYFYHISPKQEICCYHCPIYRVAQNFWLLKKGGLAASCSNNEHRPVFEFIRISKEEFEIRRVLES